MFHDPVKPERILAQQKMAAAGLADQLLHTAKELPASLFEVGFAPYFVVSIFMALAVANAKSLGPSLPILHHWREGGSLVSLYKIAIYAVDWYADALSRLSPCWLQYQASKYWLLTRWAA